MLGPSLPRLPAKADCRRRANSASWPAAKAEALMHRQTAQGATHTNAAPIAGRRRTTGAAATALALAVLCAGGEAGAQKVAPQTQAPSATAGAPACVVAPRPNSLWSLAQCCSADLKSNSDCRAYVKADEYIILKDNSPKKPAAYLIIPTDKLTGIEDAKILAAPFVDFWADAWQQAQVFVKKPAADTALAVNSVVGRTQNQLHIHIACVRPAIAKALADDDAKIGTDPATPFELTLAGNRYRVVRTTSLSGADSPFDLVRAMPGARDDMAEQSIAVVGSQTPGSFYVLDTWVEGTNRGAAEQLLDQYCQR
jgi:CDP-diacylglycerol pyrophosphatase